MDTHNTFCWIDIPVVDLDRAIVEDSEGNAIALYSKQA